MLFLFLSAVQASAEGCQKVRGDPRRLGLLHGQGPIRAQAGPAGIKGFPAKNVTNAHLFFEFKFRWA